MLCEELTNINLNNIIIMEAIKNNVLQESYFFKINYYNDIIVYNGLYIRFELKILELLNDKILYNIDENLYTFNKIYKLEYDILNILNIQKIFHHFHKRFILYIS